MIEYKNIGMEELTRKEKLSINIEKKCFQNRLYNLQSIIDHWKEHGTFKNLENAGNQLEILLSNLCNKYALLPLMKREGLSGETMLPRFIQKFDSIRKIMICQQIALTTCNYAYQTKNILAAKMRLIKTGEGVLGVLYNEDFSFLKTESGMLTCSTLMHLKNRISALVLCLAESDNTSLLEIYNEMLSHYLLTRTAEELFNPETVVDCNNKIRVFKLIDLLINSGFIFTPNERSYFETLYAGNSEKDSGVSYLNLSARLKNNLRENLYSYFYCLSFFRLNDLSDNTVELVRDFVVLNDDFTSTINHRENVSFSRAFYENILKVLFESTHHLLTGAKITKSENRKQGLKDTWSASYMIRRELFAVFKFQDFVAYIRTVAGVKRKTTDSLPFEEVVSKFLDEDHKNKLQLAKEICSSILLHEFNLSADANGLLIFRPSIQKVLKPAQPVQVFQKNSSVRVFTKEDPAGRQCSIDDIFRVLEEVGIPATINFIVRKLRELFPDMTDDALSIRQKILENKETFFHIGNTGTYGLQSWLKSGKTFRTEGTRAIAIEYLTSSDIPVDIDELLAYIKKYRLITREDITVFCENTHGKLFLKGNFVGLNIKRHRKITWVIDTDNATHVNLAEIIKDLDARQKVNLIQQIAFLTKDFSIKLLNKVYQEIREKKFEYGLLSLLLNENKLQFPGAAEKTIGTNRQLSKLKKKLDLVLKQKVFEDKREGKVQNAKILTTLLSPDSELLSFMAEAITEKNVKIKLFKLIYLLVTTGLVFDSRELEIFYLLYSTDRDGLPHPDECHNNDCKIKIELEQKLSSRLLCLSLLNIDDIIDYRLRPSDDILIVNNAFAVWANDREKVQFNTIFYAKILSQFLEPGHVLIGEPRMGLQQCKGNRLHLEAAYIVRHELNEVFNFQCFYKYVHALIHQKRNSIDKINFEECLRRFLKSNSSENLLRINLVCQKIIQEEFGLLVENNRIWNLQEVRLSTPSVHKTLSEYLLEILKDFGKVTSLRDILDELKKRYPTLNVKDESIRTTLCRRRSDFITVGRSGTYGLKSWESEKAGIKGGTIREMVKKYLENSLLPVKERALFRYVAQYRNTTFGSMKHNLLLDKGKTFIFFKGGFVGLKVKKYSPEYKCDE